MLYVIAAAAFVVVAVVAGGGSGGGDGGGGGAVATAAVFILSHTLYRYGCHKASFTCSSRIPCLCYADCDEAMSDTMRVVAYLVFSSKSV